MEELPVELFSRIFSVLDYRHLASAALVCKSWSSHSGQADLWQRLYVERWGEGNSTCFKSGKFKTWKAAYEAQDRCERVGMHMTVTREGFDYFMVYKGEILRFLGSCKNESCQRSMDSQQSTVVLGKEQLVPAFLNSTSESSCLSLNEELILGDRVEHASPQDGLVDRLLFFLGDLEYAMRETKRHRAC